MLKSSIKSVEGQSFFVVVIGGMVLLYELLTGNDSNGIPLETLMEHAKTVSEVAQAYKLENFGEGWGTAKVIAILTFIYKMYGRFADGRVKLKTKELEVQNEKS